MFEVGETGTVNGRRVTVVEVPTDKNLSLLLKVRFEVKPDTWSGYVGYVARKAFVPDFPWEDSNG